MYDPHVQWQKRKKRKKNAQTRWTRREMKKRASERARESDLKLTELSLFKLDMHTGKTMKKKSPVNAVSVSVLCV